MPGWAVSRSCVLRSPDSEVSISADNSIMETTSHCTRGGKHAGPVNKFQFAIEVIKWSVSS